MAVLVMAAALPASARPQAPSPVEPVGVALLRRHADQLRPLVESPAVVAFLDATGSLPPIAPRTLHFHRERREWLTSDAFESLDEGARVGFEARPIDENRYYQTKYGTPLTYARPLDILVKSGALPDSGFAGLRLADIGYGTVGHLRLLAGLGTDATGIDVDPFLAALYTQPGDTGEVAGSAGGAPGRVTLVHGSWPGDAAVRDRVGWGHHVILSKNTLKRGYIHPEREADPRSLISLGVSDEQYVAALHEALRPGGVVLIYNLCPAPAPPDKPYIPWADGRCPFSRETWENAGFEVLAFDERDDAPARAMFEALGYPTRSSAGEDDLFAWYTLTRRAR